MRVDEHLSVGTMTCAISPRGFLEPDDRLNVVRSPGSTEEDAHGRKIRQAER